MSRQLGDYYESLKQVRIALHQQAIEAHQVAIAELRLDEEQASVTALTEAEQASCAAARDLARAVEDLPPNLRPKGWDQS